MRAIDLIALFSSRYPQASFPADFHAFLRRQERTEHVIVRAHTHEPLAGFLESLGVPRGRYSTILDPDSRLVAKSSYPSLLSRTPQQVEAYFAKHLSPLFALQQTVLDSETLTGFNRHGREHLRAVTKHLLRLLTYAGNTASESATSASEAVIAGYLHDVGNLLSRKEHGFYGLYLLTQLLTDVDHDPQTLGSFLRVMEAVLFHEVEFGSRVDDLGELSTLTQCLIVADKTDVNLHRVSNKSNDPEAIRDAHTLLNLLTGDSRLTLGAATAEWQIHFSPKIKRQAAARFSTLLKHARRVWVPAEWQTLYRRENIEYVFLFQASFLRVYYTRLTFAIRALFALRPSLRTFRLVIQDDERGVSLSRTFSREDHLEKARQIAKNLFKNTPAYKNR
jgi:hypothetical protein